MAGKLRHRYPRLLLWGCAWLLALAMMGGCTHNFEQINRPKERVSAEELARDNYLTSAFLVQLQNLAFPVQENDYQMSQDLIGNYLGRYMTYTSDGWNAKNHVRMNAQSSWCGYPFRVMMPSVVSAFSEVRRVTQGKGVFYAWALILRAQFYLRLTDIYGPVPIGTGGDARAYSSQQEVYKSLLADLDSALAIIRPLLRDHPSLTLGTTSDNIYGGKVASWERLANSLKLRMAIRMRFVAPIWARRIGEEAVSDGVIMRNEDNCAIDYKPNGRYRTAIDWGDSRACADIESYMQGYRDPRLPHYFSETATQSKGVRAIVGCRAGAKIGEKNKAEDIYSAPNVEEATRDVWVTAAEMAFCRAEGALIGWQGMGGTAKELYEQAIALSFEQWNAYGVKAYIADDSSMPADYHDTAKGYGGDAKALCRLTIKWDDGASEEEQLERLIVQKWIALFPDGQEAWNEMRRTGYPKVFPSAQQVGYELIVPNRIPYDIDEAVSNKYYYQKALKLLGGNDDYLTRLWWQR